MALLGRRPSRAPLAGRFVLHDRIGHGGMGAVWSAWDLRRAEYVAVKLLGPADSGMLLRFVREQGVRVTHPHVVAPRSWAAEDQLALISMDLVRGGSVDDLLAEHGPLPAAYVAVLLDQLLQALAAVHAVGLVHRDVKPANLLLEPTGSGRPHLRLGDFGVAATLDEPRLTHVPGVVGTDGFVPPETLLAPDPTQDLYATGAVAAQLLTGVPPWRRLELPGGPLGPLVRSLTDPEPARRPASAAQARALLARIGVPAGTPWQAGPRQPYVVDQQRHLPRPPRRLRRAGVGAPS